MVSLDSIVESVKMTVTTDLSLASFPGCHMGTKLISLSPEFMFLCFHVRAVAVVCLLKVPCICAADCKSLATRNRFVQNHNLIILYESNYFMQETLYWLSNCGFVYQFLVARLFVICHIILFSYQECIDGFKAARQLEGITSPCCLLIG